MEDLAVGQAIRTQRLARRMTLRDLAAQIQVSPATMSAIENGKTAISLKRLIQVATVLRTGVTVLVEASTAEVVGSTTPSSASPAIGPPSSTAVSVAPTQPGEPKALSSAPACARADWREFAPLPLDVVLAGAVAGFVAKGYHGASMRSIAALSHMSVPGIYHHYRSKQDILMTILELTMGDLIWRMEMARDEDCDPLGRILRLVEALALYHMRRKDLAFIGASEMRSLTPENYRQIAALRNGVQQLLDAEISTAVLKGLVMVSDPKDAGKAISTMCTSLPSWFNPSGPKSPEQIASEYAQFALSMLSYRQHDQTTSRAGRRGTGRL
jgi:AcrR family transcriptional regulator